MSVTVADGNVESVQSFDGVPEHYVVAPGLIDLQMNGFDSVDVSKASADEFLHLDHLLLSRGTSSWLGTIVTAPLEALSVTLKNVEQMMNTSPTGCVGIHVEGPFLGNAPGAHNPEWIIPFDANWCQELTSVVKLMTVAPEQKGVLENISSLCARGILVSIGHTRANKNEWNTAVGAGAQMVTHLFNGMSGVHHRDDGVALSALTDSRVVCGLISDLVHISPSSVKLAFAAKGPDGVCLVSDSVAWNSPWAKRRNIQIIDGAPRLPDGTLAGSSSSLAACIRHSVQTCGVELSDALRAATSTPARLIGFPQMGQVAVGQRADLVVFDDELTVVEGRRGLVSIRA